MSHDASWGIVAKLGTRAIQRRRLHAHAMYGCWIMHEITLIGWPVTCGRDYLPITSACGATVPTVIPMLLSNAQILRRGHASGGWSRSEDTHEELIAPACCRSVPSTCSRPLSFCSMCYEQLSLSYRPTLQSLTSVVVGEMLRRNETYPRRLVSSRLVLDWGLKVVYEPLLDGREATVVHAVLVSWQQTSSGHLQWSRWIGFQDRWCFSSVSFLCTRTACGVTTCGVTSCPWFRPLS